MQRLQLGAQVEAQVATLAPAQFGTAPCYTLYTFTLPLLLKPNCNFSAAPSPLRNVSFK